MGDTEQATSETTNDRGFFAETMAVADSTFQADMLASRTRDSSGNDLPGDEPPPAIAPQLTEPGLARLVGETQPRYQGGGLLGSGGGGLVFAVTDGELDRQVALKVLHPRHRDDERRISALLREAAVTANLEHPGILPVHEVGQVDDGRVYFTMRKATGLTLQDLLAEAESDPERARLADLGDRVAIMITVCEAIRYAHDRGFVHQDIKPANIMLGDYGEVIVLDWGAAISLDADQPARAAGTPMYMSPEQARGERPDRRSDIYCLGATMFHCFLLRFPLLEGSAKHFWEKKRLGLIDDLNPAERTRIPDHLLQVVLKAMDPKPQHRFQQIGELIEALRGFQRNANSIICCERGEQALQDLDPDQTEYRDCETIANDFRQALSLWPGNERALRGLHDCRHRHAAAAYRRGDIGLGLELLADHSDDDDGLRQRLLTAQRRRQRNRLLARWSTAAAALLLITLVWMSIAEYQRRQSAWIPVAVLDCAKSQHSERLQAGAWATPTPPIQHSDGLLIPHWDTYWLSDVAERGDVSVTVDITWPEAVDALELVLRAKHQPPARFAHPAQGYYCQFGGFAGNVNVLGSNREPGPLDLLYAIPASFEPGRRYRLTFRLVDDRQEMAVDGQLILSRRDILPMSDAESQWISLRCWGPAVIHRIVVERKALAREVEPLVAGDALVAHGHLAQALRVYRALAADYGQEAIAGSALARAYLCALALGDHSAATLLHALRSRFPDHPDLAACNEEACLASWKAGRIQEALTDAAAIQGRDPQTRLPLRFLRHHPPAISDQQRRALLAAVAAVPALVSLDISGWGFDDISPLRGHRLSLLKAAMNQISDLSPLAGMPLRHCELDNNLVSDLTALRGSAIQRLGLRHNPVSDISALQGMPLMVLDLGFTAVDDLAALRIADGQPTGRLRDLVISHTAVDDLAPLAGHPLASIFANQTPISDLSPLRGMPLEYLNIQGSQATDLSPLANAPLTKLILNGSPVSDIGVVATLDQLQDLELHRTVVADLSPLAASRIRNLDIGLLDLADATALGRLTIDTLDATGTALPVSLLGQLQVETSILLNDPNLQPSDYEQIISAWTAADRNPTALRSLRIARALQFHDGEALRREARFVSEDGTAYLNTGLDLTLADARALARACGARLPAPTSPSQWDTLGRAISRGCWLDLTFDAQGQPRSSDGATIDPTRLLPWHATANSRRWAYLSFGASNGTVISVDQPGGTSQVCLTWPPSP